MQQVIDNDLMSLLPSGDIPVRTNCPFFKWLPLNPQNRRRLVQLGMLNHMNMSVDEMHQQVMSRILQNHILFKPVVQEIISENENTFKSYSLCIHIRTQGPSFVCSDNSVFQSTLGRMISNTSKISYENAGGKRGFNTLNRGGQAVLFAEMKLLSMCQTYLGTYRSTWSYTNALLSNGRRLFIGHNSSCSNTVSF